MSKKQVRRTILVVAANPKMTSELRLQQEIKHITEGLERSKNRELFDLKVKVAATVDDLRRALEEMKPEIVHFCGHGAGSEGIAFQNEIGEPHLVPGPALARLFELFVEHVRCVLLNACYAEMQAEAIVKHIGYVVGMRGAISDKAAIKYSVGFYDGVGANCPYDRAHKLGCSAIDTAGLPEYETPILKVRATD